MLELDSGFVKVVGGMFMVGHLSDSLEILASSRRSEVRQESFSIHANSRLHDTSIALLPFSPPMNQ